MKKNEEKPEAQAMAVQGADSPEAKDTKTQPGSVLTDPASEKPKGKTAGKKPPKGKASQRAAKTAPKEQKPKKEQRAVDRFGFGLETKRHRFVELLEQGGMTLSEIQKELGGFSATKTMRKIGHHVKKDEDGRLSLK
jgi:hypothetical protein